MHGTTDRASRLAERQIQAGLPRINKHPARNPIPGCAARSNGNRQLDQPVNPLRSDFLKLIARAISKWKVMGRAMTRSARAKIA
jgi:hypothetical protein